MLNKIKSLIQGLIIAINPPAIDIEFILNNDESKIMLGIPNRASLNSEIDVAFNRLMKG